MFNRGRDWILYFDRKKEKRLRKRIKKLKRIYGEYTFVELIPHSDLCKASFMRAVATLRATSNNDYEIGIIEVSAGKIGVALQVKEDFNLRVDLISINLDLLDDEWLIVDFKNNYLLYSAGA